MHSEISPFFPVICGKNAENLTDLSCGVDLTAVFPPYLSAITAHKNLHKSTQMRG
jgi:hypothetical protein